MITSGVGGGGEGVDLIREHVSMSLLRGSGGTFPRKILI